MRATRDTDLRIVHDRPEGWWARVNWDYEHKSLEERAADGRRNLAIIVVVAPLMIVIAFTALLAIVGGSLVFAVGTVLYIAGRGVKNR